MQGRKEHENMIAIRLEKKVLSYPGYMKGFYYYLVNKSYTTKEAYINKTIKFLEFLKDDIGFDINDVNCFKDVKPSIINMYINKMGNMKNTAKACNLYAIKNFFQYLYNDDIIDKNPFEKVSIQKDNVEHKITYLDKKEMKKVEKNIKNWEENSRSSKWVSRDYAIVVLSLSLGLRVTSVSEIDIDDINLERKTIKIVEKGNKIREVMFSEKVEQVLLQWLKDREVILSPHLIQVRALFISARKTRITSRSIFNIVEKYTKNIDKHITPHKLRSTCATNTYNKTGDIYLTADVLGHSNIANTRRYAQISEERKKKAAQAMDDILF